MTRLCELSCKACRGDLAPLEGEAVGAYAGQVPEWHVVENHHLTRTFRFRDFAQALEFVNRVGALAESEGHHPDIHLAWGRARLDVWTHKVDGLTEGDFIFAAKVDAM